MISETSRRLSDANKTIRSIVADEQGFEKSQPTIRKIDQLFANIVGNSTILKFPNNQDVVIVHRSNIIAITAGISNVTKMLRSVSSNIDNILNFDYPELINKDSEETIDRPKRPVGGVNDNSSIFEQFPELTKKLKEFTKSLDKLDNIGGSSIDVDLFESGKKTKAGRRNNFSRLLKDSRIRSRLGGLSGRTKLIGAGVAIAAGLAASPSVRKWASGFIPDNQSSAIKAFTQPFNTINQKYSEGVIGAEGLGGNGSTDAAMKFFKSKGWTDEQSAAIVGNLQTESGKNLKINSVGDGGKAYGIAQWHPDRQAKFRSEFKKDIRQSTFEEQLAFVDWELKHSEKAAGDKLRSAKSVSEGAHVVDRFYERSSGEHRSSRIANANALANGGGALATASRIAGESTSKMVNATKGILPINGRVTSGFGSRVHPILGVVKNHAGIDIAGKLGTPVPTKYPGKVVFAGRHGGHGNYVIVDHGGGIQTAYAHLNSIDVRVGQTVKSNQSIGTLGSTGRSTGPHLHYEIIKNGKKINPVAGDQILASRYKPIAKTNNQIADLSAYTNIKKTFSRVKKKSKPKQQAFNYPMAPAKKNYIAPSQQQYVQYFNSQKKGGK